MKRIILVSALAVLLVAQAGDSFAKGIDVNARDRSGQTALMRAAAAGDADSVKALIAAKADVRARDFAGQSALIMAAASGHADIMKLLLSAGARKEVKKDGRALIDAASRGFTDVVKLLLDAGVNKDTHANYPSSFSSIFKGTPGPKSMYPGDVYSGTGLGGVSMTITMGEPDTDGNIYLHYTGIIPQTAMNMAAKNGHLDVVKLLLDAGANKNGLSALFIGQTSRSRAGVLPHWQYWGVRETALDAAKEGKHQDIVDLLIAAGAGDAQPSPSPATSPSGSDDRPKK